MFSYEGMRSKRNLSLLFGIIFTIYGGAALASSLGVILPVPSLLFLQLIVEIALVVAGLLLLYASIGMISMQTGRMSLGSMVIGIVLAAVGGLPLLLRYSLLTFLPFEITFTLPPQVPAGLLVFFGVYLLATYKKLRMIAYQYGMW